MCWKESRGCVLWGTCSSNSRSYVSLLAADWGAEMRRLMGYVLCSKKLLSDRVYAAASSATLITGSEDLLIGKFGQTL